MALAAAAPAHGAYGDVYVADPDAGAGAAGAIIEVDGTSGTRTAVSANAGPGVGFAFADPTGLAISTCDYRGQEAGGSSWHLIVADSSAGPSSGAIIAVDPVTGDRTLISRNTAPAGGPNFVDPVGVAVTSDCQIIVTDRSAFAGFTGGVISVDPLTGTRTTLSENASPAGGPSFTEPFAVSLDSFGDVIVGDLGGPASDDGSIIKVDSAGNRTLISDNATPKSAPELGDPMGLPPRTLSRVFNTANSGAFGGTGGIIAVDPSPGSPRTVVSENASPAGTPEFADPADISSGVGVGLFGKQVVTDLTAPVPAAGIPGGVITVDAAGVRAVLSDNNTPAGGPQFANPTGNVVKGLTVVLVPLPPGAFTPVVGRLRSANAAARRRLALRYTLDDVPAQVRFAIERKSPGRVVNGACVRQTSGNRTGNARCTLYSRVGTLRQRGKVGRNVKSWNGRIKGRVVRPGSYRATLTATARNDDSAPPRSVDFRVKRP